MNALLIIGYGGVNGVNHVAAFAWDNRDAVDVYIYFGYMGRVIPPSDTMWYF